MISSTRSTEQIESIADDHKVEVTVDGSQATVRMLSYAHGIGWFTQKTITVDAEMLDILAEQLSAACGKIKREEDEILSADLLEL